jgi:acyl carrier protein
MAEDSLSAACRIVAAVLNRPAESVAPGDRVGSLPGWDSIAHLNIVLAVEAELGRQLTPEEITAIGTVADLAGLIAARS